MINKNSRILVCMYNFLPYIDTSGYVTAKKIYKNKKTVDVIHNKLDTGTDYEFYDIIKEYIDNDILLSKNTKYDNYEYVKEGIRKIDELCKKYGEYDKVYSRCMRPMANFLAFEYKIKNPNVEWIAEFSDPILYNTNGDRHYVKMDETYHNRLNNILKENNMEIYDTDNLNFYLEYITYLFADKIIFTNKNQMDIMLDYFPVTEIKKDIEKKSLIISHPIPEKKFYNIKKYNYDKINDSKINLAYFGRFYDKRDILDIFSSLYTLNDELKNEVLLHIFVPDPAEFQKLVDCMPIKKNIIIRPYLPYLEFLNVSQQFDCLIVTDTKTKGVYDKNPYLPSKISDYLGSGTDIWKLCERNSPLNHIDTRYTSYLDNIFTTEETLKRIIYDKTHDLS